MSVGIEVVYRLQMVGIDMVYRSPGEDRGTVPLTSFQEDDAQVSYQTCWLGCITDRWDSSAIGNQTVTGGRDRGRDRGRIGTADPETTGNDLVNFMATLENMVAAMQVTAEALGNQAESGNDANGDNGPMTVVMFLKIHPPIFGGTTNPTKADNWFQAIERALQAQQVPEDKCVEFATYLLAGEAQTAKKLELLQLKQDQMSVAKYMNKLEELCRFSRIRQGTPGDFEEWKCIKYEGGLRSDILSSVGLMKIRIFSDLVNKSRLVEECLKKAAVARSESREFCRRVHNQNFAPRGQEFKRSGSRQASDKEKQVTPYLEDVRCQRCKSFHPNRPYRKGLGLCYRCEAPGYISRNCSRRKVQDADQS
ncbi:uncharacterized protein LOC110265152 [Arachis ipaensis]|uniref:uncharacterized protein LOC110265152 n=1 Tax=Arachis ipaensis TaxID=130454 RepID=UPI000A2B7855|nr:uncharacterized protein LOC110265152 [Arachis ipaensis]